MSTLDPELGNGCVEFDEQITHYALGEISDTDRPRIEEHLLSCSACRNAFDERRAAAAFLASGEPVALSAEAGAAVAVAAAGATPPSATPPHSRPGWARSSIAASILIMILLGVLGLMERSPFEASPEGSGGTETDVAKREAVSSPPQDSSSSAASMLRDAKVRSGEKSTSDSGSISQLGSKSSRAMISGPSSEEALKNLSPVVDMPVVKPAADPSLLTKKVIQDSLGTKVPAGTELFRVSGGASGEGDRVQPTGRASGSSTAGGAGGAGLPPVPSDSTVAARPSSPGAYDARARRAPSSKKPEALRAYGEILADSARTFKNRGLLLRMSEGKVERARRAPGKPVLGTKPTDGYLYGYSDRDDSYSRRIVIDQIRCLPGETPNMMFFRFWGDNPFLSTLDETMSTFGLDVDTASYSLVRNYLRKGHLPPRDAIRTEEFVNALPSNYAAPINGDFAIYTDLVPSEFSGEQNVYVLKIGVKAREIAANDRKPLSLTLVIDESGSMQQGSRLELVKQSISTLLTQLKPNDTVAIVTFSTHASQLLAPTPVSELEKIAAAVRQLKPDGSTNLDQGMTLGYELATRHFRPEGINRVLVFSDGVANTGRTTADAILAQVLERRRSGIFLNTYGVGMGNHNDALLEQLADRGDGQCAYLDDFSEAVKLFQRNIMSSFMTIAKDAKVQVAFDRGIVRSFRQIGYENRAIAHQDFRNDAVDAGEVNAGHEVVALYEVEIDPHVAAHLHGLGGAPSAPASGGPQPNPSRSIGQVTLRYRQVDTDTVAETQRALPSPTTANLESSPEHVRLSACAVALAELLRASHWSKATTPSRLREVLGSLSTGSFSSESRELTELLDLAMRQGLRPVRSAFVQTLEQLKLNRYHAEKVRALGEKLGTETTAGLQEQLKKFEQQAKSLEEQLRALLEKEGKKG